MKNYEMKSYEIFIFSLFAMGSGVLLGVMYKDINMAFMLFGIAFVMVIVPQVKKGFDSLPA